jgi:hypothetical protein
MKGILYTIALVTAMQGLFILKEVKGSQLNSHQVLLSFNRLHTLPKGNHRSDSN